MNIRTTISIPESLHVKLKRAAAERGITLTQMVNETLERGMSSPGPERRFRTEARSLGSTLIPLDNAHQVLGEMDTREFIRKRDMGE